MIFCPFWLPLNHTFTHRHCPHRHQCHHRHHRHQRHQRDGGAGVDDGATSLASLSLKLLKCVEISKPISIAIIVRRTMRDFMTRNKVKTVVASTHCAISARIVFRLFQWKHGMRITRKHAKHPISLLELLKLCFAVF